MAPNPVITLVNIFPSVLRQKLFLRATASFSSGSVRKNRTSKAGVCVEVMGRISISCDGSSDVNGITSGTSGAVSLSQVYVVRYLPQVTKVIARNLRGSWYLGALDLFNGGACASRIMPLRSG